MTAAAHDRVALVGAASHLGEQVRDQLVDQGYPGSAVELLDLDDRVGLVTEYGDEARVVLEAGADSLPSFRLACFCGDPATSLHFAPILAGAGGLALDCTGAWWDDGDVPLLGRGSDPESHPHGILSTPHPGAALLDALQPGLDLATAVVTMLLPASAAASSSAASPAPCSRSARRATTWSAVSSRSTPCRTRVRLACASRRSWQVWGTRHRGSLSFACRCSTASQRRYSRPTPSPRAWRTGSVSRASRSTPMEDVWTPPFAPLARAARRLPAFALTATGAGSGLSPTTTIS